MPAGVLGAMISIGGINHLTFFYLLDVVGTLLALSGICTYNKVTGNRGQGTVDQTGVTGWKVF
ncbi:hypothetical protein [Nostoc sp. TCL26-01]|uniref:hypothetical protein n=1 Tax=Nostoc sp. TCL26-01 TaxID=2576904 RepID=UPI0015B7A89B|nr:hypothetical protein [Nostoc sp. TCL26-01]